MDLITWPQQPATDYATLDDIYAADDRPELDVRVPMWHGRLLRLRALSLADREWVSQHAKIDTPQFNNTAFLTGSLHKLIVRPAMTLEQAERLAAKNAAVVAALVNLGWNELSYLSTETIAAAVQRLLVAGAADGGAAGAPAGGDRAPGLAADAE